MALETASNISDLNPANPSGADRVNQGDDHIRLIKAALKATFPNITGAVTASQDQLNTNFTLPIGLVLSWYGDSESVPEGFAICDGQTVERTDGAGNITLPDLRNKVLIGAGGTYDPLDTPGSSTVSTNTGSAGAHTHTISGGEHSHNGAVAGTALTIAQLPAHKHANGVTDQNSSVFSRGTTSAATTTPDSIDNNGASGTLEGFTETIGNGQVHNHGLTIDEATHSHEVSSEGAHTHSVQVSTLQPSLALHFIMKV